MSTGHGDPFTLGAFPVLQYVLRGVKRIPKPPARTRLPVTPSILRIIKAQWTPQSDDVDYLMLWAACCVGFLRAGEFTVRSREDFDLASSLTLEDIAVNRHDNPSVVQIRLKQSKTDPFRHGVDIPWGD